MKDLVKHALTIMSGVLVFSLAFGEKVVGDNAQRWQNVCFGIAIIFFLIGLILGARAMYLIFMAGEKANGPVVFHADIDFRDLAQAAYNSITFSELAYGLGVVLLIVSGVSSYFRA